MSLARIFVSLGAGGFLLAACSESNRVDSLEIRQTTQRSVAGHLNQINDAIELVAGGAFFADLEHILDPENVSSGPISGLDSAEIDELATEITNRLFGLDTIESESDTRIVYRVLGARVCEGDETCLRVLREVPIRLEVTSPRDGALDIAIQAGVAQVIPGTIHLDESFVSVELHLPSMRTFAEELAPHLDFDVSDLPSAAGGRLTASLTKNAERDYTAALSIDEKIQVESVRTEFPISVNIAAKTSPVFSVRVDGTERRIFGDLDFSELEVAMPAAFLLEELTCSIDDTDCGPFHGTLAARLAGASASVELTRTLDRLLFTNVGLGDDTSSIKLDQTDLLTVDLNALYDRRFDVELSAFNDFVLAEISRAFTLDIGLDSASLFDQVPDLPAWTAHERLSVRFTDTPQILMGDGGDVVIAGQETTMIARVASGELSFAAEQVAPVDVGAGQ